MGKKFTLYWASNPYQSIETIINHKGWIDFCEKLSLLEGLMIESSNYIYEQTGKIINNDYDFEVLTNLQSLFTLQDIFATAYMIKFVPINKISFKDITKIELFEYLNTNYNLIYYLKLNRLLSDDGTYFFKHEGIEFKNGKVYHSISPVVYEEIPPQMMNSIREWYKEWIQICGINFFKLFSIKKVCQTNQMRQFPSLSKSIIQPIVDETQSQIKNDTTSVRLQVEFFNNLLSHLNYFNVTLKTQYSIGRYRIDGFIPELNLAIEYDEKFHKYQHTSDIARELKIHEINHRITFVRLNCEDTIPTNISKVIERVVLLKAIDKV